VGIDLAQNVVHSQAAMPSGWKPLDRD
jgi:hypothetical protein